jgi:hypothetical protein
MKGTTSRKDKSLLNKLVTLTAFKENLENREVYEQMILRDDMEPAELEELSCDEGEELVEPPREFWVPEKPTGIVPEVEDLMREIKQLKENAAYEGADCYGDMVILDKDYFESRASSDKMTFKTICHTFSIPSS